MSISDDEQFEEFWSLSQGRSEARVYFDLHPLLVSSAENVFTGGQKALEYLVQDYNDPWVKAITEYARSPITRWDSDGQQF